ncbi:MAG: hypothetical protein HQL24_03905 [Candidatus Omnitrophica bacterium]|nr:hypothetical protein [Candidatus Omnitrophota bacterium]
MGNFQGVLITPAKVVLAQVSYFVSSIFMVIFLLIVGWLISKFVIEIGVTRILKLLKLDELAHKIELDILLEKGGISYSLSELVGVICYWLSLLITFVVALNSVGLTIAAELLQRITLFVPNIIAAIFILIVGMFAAVLLRNIVKAAASNAGISQVNFFSKLTEIVVMVFAIAMALDQLQIGAKIVELTIGIILGSLGLGFAIAFGLGCKDIVSKSVSEFISTLKK